MYGEGGSGVKEVAEVNEVEEVKEVKEVKERKLLVGGDRGEVPLTEIEGVDTVDCRIGCVSWIDVRIARRVGVGWRLALSGGRRQWSEWMDWPKRRAGSIFGQENV